MVWSDLKLISFNLISVNVVFYVGLLIGSLTRVYCPSL